MLLKAATAGKLDAVKWLVALVGVDKDAGYPSPLALAAGEGHVAVVKWLLKSAGVLGGTMGEALVRAEANGHVEVAR